MTTAQKHPEPIGDLVEAAGYPPGAGWVKKGYHPRLANEDLAPLEEQTWKTYNIFAFWMSDVHSVGGYITAGSLFALGLSSWQVLVALLRPLRLRAVPRTRLLCQPAGGALHSWPGHSSRGLG